jgi:hypothetical protein
MTPAVADTQMNESTASNPKTERLFVVLDVERGGPEEMLSRFESDFRSKASECGTELKFSRITPLDLDDDQRASKFRDFRGDAMLIIGRRTEAIRANLTRVERYELGYRHVQKKQTQRISVVSEFRPSPALASQLISRLKEAGVLTGCIASPASSPGS